MVPSLDRLSRSLRDLITTVGQLRGRGVGFTSLHENLDTNRYGVDHRDAPRIHADALDAKVLEAVQDFYTNRLDDALDTIIASRAAHHQARASYKTELAPSKRSSRRRKKSSIVTSRSTRTTRSTARPLPAGSRRFPNRSGNFATAATS